MGTTNILDLNNRLTKVEKENVPQNSYTSLKNKPKINNVTLTGNKTLADIGAAAAADLTNVETLQTLTSDALLNGDITIKRNCGVKFVLCHNMILKNDLTAGGTVELCAAGTVLNPPTEDTVFPLYAKSGGNYIAPVNVIIKSDGSIIVTNYASVSTKLYGYGCCAYI